MGFLLKLAELMIFDPSSRKKQEANVSTLCHSALHFNRDKEGLHQYVSGITALLDRLELFPYVEGRASSRKRTGVDLFDRVTKEAFVNHG